MFDGSLLCLKLCQESIYGDGGRAMSPVIHTTPETARTDPQRLDRKALSAPALRTFFRIAELWGLSVDEQMTLLGATSRSTFFT